MTRTFAVDRDNDLYLDDADGLAIATGLTAALQDCEHAAKTLLGEMVLAVNDGIPYFETAWAGTPNAAVFEAAMRQRLLAVTDVTGIVALTTARAGDRLTYAATISTIYGEGEIGG